LAEDLTARKGGQITNEYDMPGFKGFAGVIPDSVLAEFKNLKEDGGIINGIGESGLIGTCIIIPSSPLSSRT
jgi:hypothetical protein